MPIALSHAAGPNHNVTFRGVPFPGVNVSAHTVVKSGTRNYGVTRAANGHYVLQTDVLWNGQPVYHAHGTTFVELSICSFTSVDGYSWQWGGVIANWSAVVGNVTDPRPGDVLNPVMWGPSECDVALLSDNKTLFSVLRMDGDSGCFAVDVPPKDRDANHTTYRNYAGSFSTDNGEQQPCMTHCHHDSPTVVVLHCGVYASKSLLHSPALLVLTFKSINVWLLWI